MKNLLTQWETGEENQKIVLINYIGPRTAYNHSSNEGQLE